MPRIGVAAARSRTSRAVDLRSRRDLAPSPQQTLRVARGMLVARRVYKLVQRRPGGRVPDKTNRIIVTVIGVDTVGIIAAVATVLAEARVNIVDISQTTLREFFTMIMMADMEKASVPFDELKRRLVAKGEQMGLKIDAQHEDVFKFMHRI